MTAARQRGRSLKRQGFPFWVMENPELMKTAMNRLDLAHLVLRPLFE
jgi:hypothetical protein